MRTAVFTSSEIQNTWDATRPVAFEYPDGTTLYSTGHLEEALLLEGCRVHVVSTRAIPQDHDAWWVKLVTDAGGHIFWADIVEGEVPDLSTGWRSVFAFLGERWPKGAHWTAARFALADRGYRLGHTFVDGARRSRARQQFQMELCGE